MFPLADGLSGLAILEHLQRIWLVTAVSSKMPRLAADKARAFALVLLARQPAVSSHVALLAAVNTRHVRAATNGFWDRLTLYRYWLDRRNPS